MNRPWAWAVAQQVGRQSANYVVFVLLALLLTPRDFGVVSLAASWIAFLSVFGELGFGAALVQRPKLEPGHLSTTFALNIGAGAVLTLLGVATAEPLARFFHTPEAAPVFLALSFGFLLNAPGLSQAALAQRELRFRDLALRDTAAALMGGAVGIVLALTGWGVWSLVAQTLTTTTTGNRSAVADLALAAKAKRGESGARPGAVGLQLPDLLVQRVQVLRAERGPPPRGVPRGAGALGVYAFAFRLVVSPVATLSGAIGNYLFPRFARLQQDRAAVSAVYLRATGALETAVLPPLALAAVIAPLAIPLLFGARWADAAVLVQLFASVAGAQLHDLSRGTADEGARPARLAVRLVRLLHGADTRADPGGQRRRALGHRGRPDRCPPGRHCGGGWNYRPATSLQVARPGSLGRSGLSPRRRDRGRGSPRASGGPCAGSLAHRGSGYGRVARCGGGLTLDRPPVVADPGCGTRCHPGETIGGEVV